jgi:uncharacterized repeat protein (TIGR02543 family)
MKINQNPRKLHPLVSGLLTLAILASGGVYLVRQTPPVNALTADFTVSTEPELTAKLADPLCQTACVIAIDADITITARRDLPAGANITLTSVDPSDPHMLMKDPATNISLFRLYTTTDPITLTLTDIILDGNKDNAPNAPVGLVIAANNTTLNIQNGAVIQNNHASNGGAFQMDPGSTLNMTGGRITNNTASNGGIMTANGANINISGGQIDHNSTLYNSGIYSNANTSFNISGGEFSYNTAVSNAAVLNIQKDTTITGGRFHHNSANNGGAIYVNAGTSLTLSGDTEFSENTANSVGGAIYVANGSSISVGDNVKITDNHAAITAGGSGGGIGMGNGAADSRTSLTISGHAEISGNTVGTRDSDTGSGAGGGVNTGSYVDVVVRDDVKIHHNSAKTNGGGIRLGSFASLVVQDSVEINHNQAGTVDSSGGTLTAGNGGGIYADSGNATTPQLITITDNATITDNFATSHGGGLLGSNFTNFTLSGSAHIDNNRSGLNGGGVNLGNGNASASGIINLSGNATVNNNTAGQHGGGFLAGTYADVTLTGNVQINNNSAGINAGGLYVNSSSNLAITGANISGNRSAQTANGNVGGVFLSSGTADRRSTLTITGATINNNRVGYDASGDLTGFVGYGGGVNALHYVDIEISGGTTINGNYATTNGGGLYVGNYSSLTLNDAEVNGNHASQNGGGAYLNNVTDLTLENARINGNYAAQNGGGVFGNASNPSRTIILDGNSEVNGNESGLAGGGLYVYYDEAAIRGNSVISGNIAGTTGGGIWSYSLKDSLVVSENARISQNEAGENGGGIYQRLGSLEVTGGQIDRNTAGADGGGIHLASSSTAAITGSANILRNVAGRNGGGVWLSYQNLANLDVGPSVVFAANSAALSETRIAPVDQPVYDAHIFGLNWTNPFVEGYNNYDIAYTADKFTVSFESNGGSEVSDLLLYHGDLLFDWPDISTARTGYNFLGWYNDEALIDPYDFTQPVTADLKLFAKWDLIPEPPAPTPPFTPNVPNTGLFGLSIGATASILLTIILTSMVALVITFQKLKKDLQTRKFCHSNDKT